MKPEARTEGLIVQGLDDETVVYDLERDRVHRLNPVAAAVWRRCDGQRDIQELGLQVSRDLGARVGGDVVHLALERLATRRLLKDDAARFRMSSSRREVVRRMAAAALVPIVTTILAPDAASAATQLPAGSCCTAGSGCLSGNCNAGVNCNTRPPGSPPCPGGKCCGA
jgi:hypothetical protein